jgi:hypothetical protein
MLLGGGANPYDPKAPELAFALTAVAVTELLGPVYRLLGGAVELALG